MASALGVVAAVALIAVSLVALNRTVLPFKGWPSADREGGSAQQVLPEAPKPAGRGGAGGRTLPGGLGGAFVLPVAAGAAAAAEPLAPGVTVPGRGGQADRGLRAGRPTTGAPQNTAPVVRPAADTDNDGIPDTVERRLGTSPTTADTDGDGIPDGWEVQHDLNPKQSVDETQDPDGDGLTNATEYRLKTNPRMADSNGDGTPDGQDDTDGDGLTNAVEQELDIDPVNPDSKGDGIPDSAQDTDGDGIPNAVELELGLDPAAAETTPGQPDGALDSDGDGLSNASEISLGTQPNVADSDGNGIPDGAEDPDGDGTPSADEIAAGRDPLVADGPQPPAPGHRAAALRKPPARRPQSSS